MVGLGYGSSSGAHQALADPARVPRDSPLLAMLPVRATFRAAWGGGEDGQKGSLVGASLAASFSLPLPSSTWPPGGSLLSPNQTLCLDSWGLPGPQVGKTQAP